MPTKIRLQKFIAEAGIVSRRKAEEFIEQGRVKVNGEVVTRLGTKVNPSKDKVQVNGKLVRPASIKVYLKIYKPCGVVSSCRGYKEKTILDFVRHLPYRLFPVGRLDKESEGLMILTNDGEFANKMMHPRYGHEKEYIVETKLTINNEQLTKLKKGIILDGKRTLPAKVKKLDPREFSIVLREGKKRQIRRMVEAVGNRAVQLKRIRIQNVELGKLEPGEFEYLESLSLSG